MEGKMSITRVAGIGAVGIVLGFAASIFLSHRVTFVAINRASAARSDRMVQIKLLDNHICEFRADGHTSKFPVIKKNNGVPGTGDTITWYAQEGRSHHHPGALSFTLNFPAGGTPFTDSGGAPKTPFTDTDNNSGESNSSTADYSYLSVTFPDGDSCQNAQDPGVHVDQ
jgi:hypothetical protein